MNQTTIEQPILVTGATGFIGSHLVAALLNKRYKVRAVVLPEEPVSADWDDRVKIYRGDIADYALVERALRGAKTVFHLAALVQDWGRESLHQQVTVKGTENICRAALHVKARVVLVSSIAVYGDRIDAQLCTEDAGFGRPLGSYGRSKQEQERIVQHYAADRGLRSTIVRPSNVYGAGSRPWVDEVAKILRKGGITLVGDGNQNAGLCYVVNLVDVLVRAASRPCAVGRVYNAADEFDISWRRYFSDLARLAGTRPPRAAPLPLARFLARIFENIWKIGVFTQRPPITMEALNLVGSHHRISMERTRNELAYRPLVSYEESLDDIEKYLREQMGLRAE